MTNDFFLTEFKNQVIVKKNNNKKEFIIFDKALWESKILKKICGKITEFRFSKKKKLKQAFVYFDRIFKKKIISGFSLIQKIYLQKKKTSKNFYLIKILKLVMNIFEKLKKKI